MAMVTISNIKKQHILADEDYGWLLENLNTPILIEQIMFYSYGDILSFTVRNEKRLITLFVDSNEVSYTIKGVDGGYKKCSQ